MTKAREEGGTSPRRRTRWGGRRPTTGRTTAVRIEKKEAAIKRSNERSRYVRKQEAPIISQTRRNPEANKRSEKRERERRT